MKHSILHRVLWLLIPLLTLSIPKAWGATVKDTVEMTGFANASGTSYQNITKTDKSAKKVDMVAYAYAGNGQVRGSKTTIAGATVTSSDNSKNWSLYNSSAMPGAITSVTIISSLTDSTNNAFQNHLYLVLGKINKGSVTTVSENDSCIKVAPAYKKVYAFSGISASKGFTFFKICSDEKFTKGSVIGVKVIITYETGGGGGSTPTLSLTGSGAFGNVNVDGTKDLNFTLTGSNLTANASVSVSGTGFSLVTPASGSLTQTSGSISGSNNITVRFSPTTSGSYNGTLTVSSTGATNATVSLSGTGQLVDNFIDDIQSTSGYTSGSPHEEAGSYSTPTLSDKTARTDGTCAQQHWHFVGWVPEAYQASPKGHITNGGTSVTADGTTYYAVWSKGVGGGSFDNTAGGDFYIYATVNGTNYYATSISTSKLQQTSNIAEATKFTFTKISNGVYSISDGSNYLYNTSASGTNLGTQASSFSWTISEGSHGSWRVIGNTRALAYRAGVYNYFGAYTTGNINGTEYFDIEIGGGATYSDSIAVCCTQLGQINGSFKWTHKNLHWRYWRYWQFHVSATPFCRLLLGNSSLF